MSCTGALAPLAPGSWPSTNELGGLERARVSSERQALAAACRERGWQLLEPGDEAGLAAQERNVRIVRLEEAAGVESARFDCQGTRDRVRGGRDRSLRRRGLGRDAEAIVRLPGRLSL